MPRYCTSARRCQPRNGGLKVALTGCKTPHPPSLRTEFARSLPSRNREVAAVKCSMATLFGAGPTSHRVDSASTRRVTRTFAWWTQSQRITVPLRGARDHH
ncbi:Uncharacterised protein [Mycobacterium tuberculosis]|nr:Uncharacterised protein [Mycobacterium tuberculosis]